MSRMIDDTETPGGLNLAERIRRLAHGRTTLDVAQFQFIGMTDIRARYGERWAEKRERVAQVAQHFISRRIAAEDVLAAGADGFLLVFGSQTGVLADMAAQRISKELNAFFLGEPDLDDVRIEARHLAMSVDDFAEAFSALIASRETQPAAQASPEITMGWIPVWETRRGALATYFISPLDAATGRPLDWDADSRRHADMDERKLNASEAAMREAFAGSARSLVGVAVHVSSLNGPGLSRIVQAMAKFDPALARYRVLRMSGVEPGFPRIYLEDAMRAVRPHAGRIAIGLNWMEPDVAGVLKLQPAAIGFSVTARALAMAGQRNEMFAKVGAAVQQARALGVRVGVEGDIHPEHAQRFVQEGVDFICSPRIWPVQRALPAAEVWPKEKLEALAAAASASAA